MKYVDEEVFSESYFAFWVLISIAWGFGAAIAISFLWDIESQDEIGRVFSGMLNYTTGKEGDAGDYAEVIPSPLEG
eukprot:CAMPEP_0196192220 /NCGR_PEP_ID=MMETSP0911-20130528/48902_1 /TAXON_ID=49265 /ORGANISM="Thalassiosira rotula, Strain GSO102" /LENGTH=75 /DNA_ID=CAMNT_0041464393 /DNA_START=507 /DNA_END=734 /DNA_ORIENTATION=-